MAKLTGAKKKAFLERMAKGRRKAGRANPKKKAAKKKPAAKKAAKRKAAPKKKPAKKKANGKLTGAKKAAFLARMAKGRKKAGRANPKKKAGRKAARGTKAHHAPKKRKAQKRRRNSGELDSAERMFETFHGKAPGRIVEYDESYHYPENYAEMGRLIELRFALDSANKDFPLSRFGATQAVCTPDGSNIYFIGGDQSVDFEALDIASDKDFVELGPCTYICYLTVKGFHDFEPTKYWHRFGEEDKIQPYLAYDRLNKKLFLLGGNYRVRAEGIVN